MFWVSCGKKVEEIWVLIIEDPRWPPSVVVEEGVDLMPRKMGKPEVEKAKLSAKSKKEKIIFSTKVYLMQDVGRKRKTIELKFNKFLSFQDFPDLKFFPLHFR